MCKKCDFKNETFKSSSNALEQNKCEECGASSKKCILCGSESYVYAVKGRLSTYQYICADCLHNQQPTDLSNIKIGSNGEVNKYYFLKK